ncbi:MAG: DUF362 domain-containing protein, partial [Thermodesulfobacteriota bacterium]|nr:DUF362 domain-containing protein [Thermodesulfobacteriota bacterium]
MSKVSFIYTRDYKDVKAGIEKAINLLDNVPSFYDKRVLLKVNLMKGAPPDRALNTHPEFVRAMIRIVKEKGGKPLVGDSSGLVGLTNKAFEASGIAKVAKEEGAELKNFDAMTLHKKEIPGEIIQNIWIPEELLKIDVRITLPKLKTHTLTVLTGAIKNQMGLLPGGTKSKIHQLVPAVRKLSRALVDINL